MEKEKSADLEKKKAKPTLADQAAAARLRSIWASKKKALKLRQAELATEMGITQPAVSAYLRGAMGLNYRALMWFATYTQCKPDELRTDLPEQKLAADQKEVADNMHFDATTLAAVAEQIIDRGEGSPAQQAKAIIKVYSILRELGSEPSKKVISRLVHNVNL